MAQDLEAIWYTMSWQTLIWNHVPESIVARMQEENQDLFQHSPWQGKGAFFFDAILMALVAFKLEDRNAASALLGHKPGQGVSGILRDIRLTGVSGFLNYTKHPEARMNLRQLRAGAYVSVASLAAERVLFTRPVIFPNGGSDPRAYDYKPHSLPSAQMPQKATLPVDQQQRRSYHTVQYDASGDGQQEQKVPDHMDLGSTITKTAIGCVVVVLVCIALPSRDNVSGWARTVINVRHPGGQSHRLSPSHHDDEAADKVSE